MFCCTPLCTIAGQQTQYESSGPAIVCHCLDIVGKYVSWIDIGLIANERFMAVILGFLCVAALRESACDCVSEIVSKGMDPGAKVKLVETLSQLLEKDGHFTLPQVSISQYQSPSMSLNTLHCLG